MNLSEIALFLLDFYLVFIVVFFVLILISKEKKLYGPIRFIIFVFAIYKISMYLNVPKTSTIYTYIFISLPLFIVILYSSDIRKAIESIGKKDISATFRLTDYINTRENIADAAMQLSSTKVGALITLEKHTSLDQYANRAINMNAYVTRELLINIFSPNTPLHDGAVIISNNRIRCAAAYYEISEETQEDKTMGSRHRAAIGISEVSDSMTVIVSEETGKISISLDGVIVPMKNRETLVDYLDMFVNKK